MPKLRDYTLTEGEQAQIGQAMKHRDARVVKRATVVQNLHLGYTPQAAARLHQISLASGYQYFNRFKAEGRAGLPDKAKSGRPAKATETYIVLLEQT